MKAQVRVERPYWRDSLFSTPGDTVSEVSLPGFLMERRDVPLRRRLMFWLKIKASPGQDQSKENREKDANSPGPDSLRCLVKTKLVQGFLIHHKGFHPRTDKCVTCGLGLTLLQIVLRPVLVLRLVSGTKAFWEVFKKKGLLLLHHCNKSHLITQNQHN